MARPARSLSPIELWIFAFGMLVGLLLVAGASGWMTGKLAFTFGVALSIELAVSAIYVRRLGSGRSLDRLSGPGALFVLATLSVGIIEMPCFRAFLHHDWCERHYLDAIDHRPQESRSRESASTHAAMKLEALG
jgi:hypothetical protein